MHIPVSTPKYTVNREEMFVIETRDIVTKFVEETLAADHNCTIVLATILCVQPTTHTRQESYRLPCH